MTFLPYSYKNCTHQVCIYLSVPEITSSPTPDKLARRSKRRRNERKEREEWKKLRKVEEEKGLKGKTTIKKGTRGKSEKGMVLLRGGARKWC